MMSFTFTEKLFYFPHTFTQFHNTDSFGDFFCEKQIIFRMYLLKLHDTDSFGAFFCK